MTDQIDAQRVIRRLAQRIADLEVENAHQAAAISQLVEQQARAGNTAEEPARDNEEPPT